MAIKKIHFEKNFAERPAIFLKNKTEVVFQYSVLYSLKKSDIQCILT